MPARMPGARIPDGGPAGVMPPAPAAAGAGVDVPFDGGGVASDSAGSTDSTRAGPGGAPPGNIGFGGTATSVAIASDVQAVTALPSRKSFMARPPRDSPGSPFRLHAAHPSHWSPSARPPLGQTGSWSR